MFIVTWETWSISYMFWVLGDVLKGEIWNWKPRIWLDCVESWKIRIDWETVALDNRMLVEPELIKNLREIVIG